MRQCRENEHVQETGAKVRNLLCADILQVQECVGYDGSVVDGIQASVCNVDSPTGVASACACIRYPSLIRENRAWAGSCHGVSSIMKLAE
jgi:hypothetical protein